MFLWKEEYSVNVMDFDAEHKRLFDLGTKLYDLVKLKNMDIYDEILTVLGELEDYTLEHFEHEESLMEQHGYPEVDEHKSHHMAFVNKLKELKSKDLDETQSKVTMELLVFIADWISVHILKIDKKYTDFLNSKGVY